jgi:hypothetical protein
MSMRLNKILFGISFLGLLSFSNNVFSQDIGQFTNSNKTPNPNKVKWGLELGVITNKDTRGITSSIYFSNPRVQLNCVIEGSTKYRLKFLEDQMDILKFGVGAEYFPTNFNVIRPYIGSEVKYEDESLFVAKENRNYKKNGVGFEMKIGTELKPFRYSPIKLFLELGYNISVDKKSGGYPENPEILRDKFITVAGIKF